MAIGYFIAPYVRKVAPAYLIGAASRYVIINDLTATILADGGSWGSVEVLGNQAIAKVSAAAATLTAIAALTGVTRVHLSRLNDSLSTLTAGQRAAIRTLIINAGYTIAEVDARFPDLTQVTIGEALRFLATRRLRPRYDSGTDSIVLDGPVQACESVDALDAVVV